jgi:hypothetical protein
LKTFYNGNYFTAKQMKPKVKPIDGLPYNPKICISYAKCGGQLGFASACGCGS